MCPRGSGKPTPLPDAHLLRDSLRLPEMSQGELVRYYTALSARNYGIDSGTYPLGSCTMKYNPKVNDLIASLPGFAEAHPHSRPRRTCRARCGRCWSLRRRPGRDHRSARRESRAGRRRAGRVGRRADDHPAALQDRGELDHAPPHPRARLGARHQPGHRRDGRLPGHPDPDRRGRLARPRHDRAGAGRDGGRRDGHRAQHAGTVGAAGSRRWRS